MLLNSVGLEVREPHGFGSYPLTFVMARDRLSGETRIVLQAGLIESGGGVVTVGSPTKFLVEMQEAVREMAVLLDKWILEGDDWDAHS